MQRTLAADPGLVVRDAGDLRQPTWSGFLTQPMARWIPEAWRHGTLVAIKGILPAAVARQIPRVAGSSAALALGLNLRALLRRSAA